MRTKALFLLPELPLYSCWVTLCSYWVEFYLLLVYPLDIGCKLNVHKTFRTSSERLMYVQFTSCAYGADPHVSGESVIHCKANPKVNEMRSTVQTATGY